MGVEPLAALFSASKTCRGSMFGRAEEDEAVFDGGSLELQLETPMAASSPKAITVVTSRSGVQNLIFLTSVFLSDITNSLLFTEPERVEDHGRLASYTNVVH